MARRPTQTEDTAATDGQDDLALQLAALRADLERIAQTVAGFAGAGKASLHTTLREGMETLKDKGEAELADASARAEDLLAEAEAYARRKPLHALAMAGGLGMLLGLLFGRR